jgi:nitroreductase
MDLYDVMRTTFAAREFTDEPMSDELIYRILENARFAPSGGNRQAGRVIVVRDMDTRKALVELSIPGARRYVAQLMAGETPWNTLAPPSVGDAQIAQTEVPAIFTEPLLKSAAVLVVCADLADIASTDQDLDRIGVVSGASVYPFVWNILLAARNEGYGGTITTMAVPQEPQLKELLGLPDSHAVCAVIPLGKPVKQLTKLRRNPVESFAVKERWGGTPLQV